jgi:voltage-gated potassium channel Kch
MDRGTPALIGWLAFASLVLVFIVTGLVMLIAPTDARHDGGFGGILWRSLMRAMDPGTVGGDTGGPLFLGLMLAVTIGGIFIVSSLIGVLTAGLENRIAELRKGRSKVNVSGHAVILGWSDQVFTVITELVKANITNTKGAVVVLADRDKVEMQDEVKARCGDVGRLRVICRSGSPLKRSDLELVSLDTARSIMVLPAINADGDVNVIKALLLLHNRPWPNDRPHVVAAVQDTHNLAAARLAAGNEAQVIDADDITVRLVVQSHRQSGLSTVYTDLLDFSGNEVYLKAEPSLVGKDYGEALHAFRTGAPIGLCRDDGKVVLNPASNTLITAADKVIVVAEDELLISLATEPPSIAADRIVEVTAPKPVPDQTLIIGWNARGPKVLDLLDQLVPAGSTADVAAPTEPTEALLMPRVRLLVGYKPCQPTNRQSLEKLDLAAYQHIIVLADDSLPPDQADDRTLVTLLHLRDIEITFGDPYSIVTEMNDDANREIAQVTKADDFIVSNRFITLLLTQLAENELIRPVLTDLFDPAGSEIVLKPAGDYVQPGGAVTFSTVVEAARRRGESAMGYRLARDGEVAPSFGVVLNPDKEQPIEFDPSDSIVVVAER